MAQEMTNMADTPGSPNTDSGAKTQDQATRRAKLAQIKAELFRPETKQQRIAYALEALQKAKKISNLDSATLKYIAQHADLEGV